MIKKALFTVIIVFLLLFLGGCVQKNDNDNNKEKLIAEIEYMENTISQSVSEIIGGVDTSGYVKEEKENKENTEESSKKKSSDESSGNNKSGSDEQDDSGQSKGNNNTITNMSVEYKEPGKNDSESENEMAKNIDNLYASWLIVEQDIMKQNLFSTDELDGITKIIDDLSIDATNKDKSTFIDNASKWYSNMIKILSKLDFDEDKLHMYNIKQNVYEAYYAVLNDDWDSAIFSIELMRNKVDDISRENDKAKTIFKNLSIAADTKNKELFFIRCIDALDELKYIK